MKIKVPGSELKKVDIEFLSLVKRGANRSPFKVVKSEEPANGLVAGVKKFFQINTPEPSVVAVFVEKSALEKSLPNLAVAGFDLSNHEMQDSVVVFKQAGFDDAKTVIMLKSESAVGMAIANISNYSAVFNGSLSFDPTVAETGFYPGINASMAALQATVNNVSKAEAPVQVTAFEQYVSKITHALPDTIWKFESLQRGFGGVTNDSTDGETVNQSEIVKAAAELAQKLLKAGAQDEAKKQTGSSSSETDENSGSSELAGSSDDSIDDEASRKAKMAKGANDTTSSETVGEDKARKANGTDTSESKEMSKQDKSVVKKPAADMGSSDESSSEDSSSTTTSEDGGMMKKTAKPVVMKDADGTEYHLAVCKSTGNVIKFTPGAKIPEGHAEMTMPWEQDGALGGTNNGNGQGMGKAKADEDADYEVSHTGAGGDRGNMDGKTPAGSMKKSDLEAAIASLATLPEMVKKLAEQSQENSELLKKTTERVDSIEKTAQTAIKKADNNVVHVGANFDSAYESLGGGRRDVRKSASKVVNLAKAQYDDSLWTGALGVIERHTPGDDE